MIEVFLNYVASLLRQIVIQIPRDVVPDVFAIYDHGSHLRFAVLFIVFN